MKVKFSEVLFFIGMIAIMLGNLFMITEYPFVYPGIATILKLIRYLGYMVIVVKILYDIFYLEDIIKTVLFIIFMVLSVCVSKDKELLFIGLMIVGARGIELEKILKCLCTLQVIVVVCTLLGCVVHIIPDVVFDLDNRIRHTVGFYYVSYLPHIYTMFVIEWLYLKRYTIKYYEYIMIIVGNLLIYKISATRVDFGIIFLIILLHFMVSKGIVVKQLKSVIKFILKNSTLLCAGCMLILTVVYNDALRILDKLLSNRLHLGHHAIKKYGIHILGQKITWLGYNFENAGKLKGDYQVVDSSYIHAIINYGLIVFVIFIILLTLVEHKAVIEKNYFLAVSLMVCSLAWMIDPLWLDLAFNPFIFLTADCFEKNFTGYFRKSICKS